MIYGAMQRLGLCKAPCKQLQARIPTARLCTAVGGLGPVYTAPSTGAQFVVNTTFDGWEGAETNCKANGGHLVAYTSQQEQVGGGVKPAAPR
jgi:hypothetical protein